MEKGSAVMPLGQEEKEAADPTACARPVIAAAGAALPKYGLEEGGGGGG